MYLVSAVVGTQHVRGLVKRASYSALVHVASVTSRFTVIADC